MPAFKLFWTPAHPNDYVAVCEGKRYLVPACLETVTEETLFARPIPGSRARLHRIRPEVVATRYYGAASYSDEDPT